MITGNLDEEILSISNDPDLKNNFIQKSMPFIIKSISDCTGSYVNISNSDELSIGMLAFDEAICKFKPGRGTFFPFARLVIASRIKTHMGQTRNHPDSVSLEEMQAKGIDFPDSYFKPEIDSNELQDEILSFRKEIEMFGFGLSDLAADRPRHADTRNKAFQISELISKDDDIIKKIYEKLRLPITLISNKFTVSVKIIKGSKKFIISVTIVLHRRFRNMTLWIRGQAA